MALKPQLLATTFVVLIATTAMAQQPGPWTGPPAGSGGSVIYATQQAPFAAPTGNAMAYNAVAPAFAQPEMPAQTGELQLASSTYEAPMYASSPPNMASVPADPNANPAPMVVASGMNAAYGTPVAANGMVYGPGQAVPPGYPPMQMAGPGPGPYGPLPIPQPATPRWYLRGEAVWLFRDAPNIRNLTTYDNASKSSDPLNNRVLLDTDDLPFGLAPGMRITVGHYLTDRTAIEGAYYGANNWDEHTGTPQFPSANGQGPLSAYWGTGGGPFSTSAFTNSNQQFASYESSFDSAEINIRQWFLPSLSGLVGFRYINVADQFQLTATNNASNDDAGQVGYYRTWTNNNMIGLQAGADFTHDLYMRWLFFSIEAKTGAFMNFADQKNLLFNTDTTYDQRSSRETQFTTMFDLSVALTALVSDHVTLRGGYTFLFLDGVALATDQLDTNPTMNNSRDFLADKGTLTLQGPFVGAEVAW
jgi:hypothetical protein